MTIVQLRTLTFTFEDALLSPKSFSILSGAGLIDASDSTPIYVHQTVQTTVEEKGYICITADSGADIHVVNPYDTEGDEYLASDANAPVYILNIGADVSEFKYEPCVPAYGAGTDADDHSTAAKAIKLVTYVATQKPSEMTEAASADVATACVIKCNDVDVNDTVIVDYYVRKTGGATQIEITPDKFGGYFYLEASTLFRKEATGEDMAAVFVIPRMKIQSNFTFTMAATGDPSTFSFTADAFPAYTKFDRTKRVLALLQVIDEAATSESAIRYCDTAVHNGGAIGEGTDGQQEDPDGP